MAAKAEKRERSKSGGGSAAQFLVAMFLVTLLAGGAGAGFGLYQKDLRHPQKKTVLEPSHVALASAASTEHLVKLPPIVTNLGNPTDIWVRLEAAILVDPKVQHPDALAAQIGDDFLAYLRTTSLRELQGPIGLDNLQETLEERASARSGGAVTSVMIETLVLQ